MLLALKFLCEKTRVRRDGTAIIYLQFTENKSQKVALNTGIVIPFLYWDTEHQMISLDLPEIHGNSEELNEELRRLARIAEDIITVGRKRKLLDLAEFLKMHFSPTITPFEVLSLDADIVQGDVRLNKDFFFQIDHYIKTKMHKVAPDMARIYRNMKDHLLCFQEFRNQKIAFDSLDIIFYEELVDFLTYDYIVQKGKAKGMKGIKVNTIGKTIRQLKTFLHDRMRKKLIQPIDLSGWKVLEEEIDAVYLSWPEINNIFHVDLSEHPNLEYYRNDFVLGCLTGLRFSDLSDIEPDDIRGGMLYKKQKKSKHWVVIPLREQALQLLEKRFTGNFDTSSNPEFNRHIKTVVGLAGVTQPIKHSHRKKNKEVFEVKPKNEWVTTHTCRRSFCTNEFLAGTPVELIMKISGHKSVKNFYRYIRISPEEAAGKLRDIWGARGDTLFSSPNDLKQVG